MSYLDEAGFAPTLPTAGYTWARIGKRAIVAPSGQERCLRCTGPARREDRAWSSPAPATASVAPSRLRMTASFVFDGDPLVCERSYFDTLPLTKQLLSCLDFRKPRTFLLLARALRGAASSLGNQGKPRDAVHMITE